MVACASGEQLGSLTRLERTPLALAERARWLVRDTRLDRACAGLCLLRAGNADSELLALRLICEVAPWPETVRVELREGAASGRLVAAAGAEQASEIRCLVRGNQGYQVAGTAKENLELSQALLRLLEDDQKALLGETEQALRDRLATLAADDRARAARFIGLAPVGQGLRPLHRFADGRTGYPLSGRGESSRQAIRRGLHQVFPTLTDDQMDAYLAQLTHQGTGLWEHYSTVQQQLSQLRASLVAWCNEATGMFEAFRRRRVAQQFRRSWRRKITNRHGEHVLEIDGERVGLPALPPGLDFQHVDRLVLTNMGLDDISADFLPRFSNLVELDLRNNQLSEIPAGLERLTLLRRLNLSGNAIVMTNEGERRLASLSHLAMLDLSHNPLGRAPVLTGLHQLNDVRLRGAGLGTMPEPVSLRGHLDLRDNRIRQLREEVNELREQLQQVSLHDNPLDQQSQASLDLEAGVQRASRGGGSFTHRDVDDVVRDDWIGKKGPSGERRRVLWRTLRDEPGSNGLFQFLADFIETEDFSNCPRHYRKRIWRILEACEQHEQLRLRVFAEASGPRSCEDQLLLILEQLELSVLVERVSNDVPVAELESHLVRLGRGLSRLDAVDRYAAMHLKQLRKSRVADVDDIETRLFFRLRLMQPLALPIEPETMHFEDFAHVSAQDLRKVRSEVLDAENRESLIDSLAQRPFWEAHVRERYPGRFDEVRLRFDELLEQIDVDRAAGIIDEWGAVQRSTDVMREYLAAERDLVMTLAREAYDRQDL